MNSEFTFFAIISLLGLVFFGFVQLLKRYYIYKSKNDKDLSDKDTK